MTDSSGVSGKVVYVNLTKQHQVLIVSTEVGNYRGIIVF